MMERGVLEITETPGTSTAWIHGVDGDKVRILAQDSVDPPKVCT